jgi:hypothetical protein
VAIRNLEKIYVGLRLTSEIGLQIRLV